MAELVVGVDGGNSKTDLVLADTEGRLLAHVRGPGTRSYADGIDTTIRNVAALVGRARHEALVPDGTPIRAGAYFLANLDLPADEQAAAAIIATLGLCTVNVVHNDTFAVLHAGAPDGWGVAVVSGAGINATGVDSDGRVARFLSLGELSGDWGGGDGLAVAALGAAIRAGDGRGPATILRATLPRHFSMEEPEELALAVAHKRIRRSDLHVLAPAVFDAATGGDEVAAHIVLRLGDEIAVMVEALLRRLDLLETVVPVILGGGTLQFGPPLLHARIDSRLAGIAPKAQTRLLDVPPVAGAVLHALSIAGAEATARVLAREAFQHSRFADLLAP